MGQCGYQCGVGCDSQGQGYGGQDKGGKEQRDEEVGSGLCTGCGEEEQFLN